LFDARYFLYCEEVDHCQAVRKAGWKVMFYPFSEVIHLGGESAMSAGPIDHVTRQASSLQIESELLYFRKHYGLRGLLTWVLFVGFGDLMRGCNGLLRHRDGLRTKAAIGHSWKTIERLVATGLASHATR
jgi:GT2 family glycosyltransferase